MLVVVALITTLVGVGSPYQNWVNQSHVPTPPGYVHVAVSDDSCGDGGACTTGKRSIEFPSGIDRTAHYEFMHEIGHVFDFTVLRPKDRTLFKTIMDLKSGWWKGWNPPGEQFAMGYAFCALANHRPRFYWGYGYIPTLRQHHRVCHLIRQAPQR